MIRSHGYKKVGVAWCTGGGRIWRQQYEARYGTKDTMLTLVLDVL